MKKEKKKTEHILTRTCYTEQYVSIEIKSLPYRAEWMWKKTAHIDYYEYMNRNKIMKQKSTFIL